MTRTIGTLGKTNKATLRKVFKNELGLPKNANETKLMEALEVSDKKEMYELMAIMFNGKIEGEKGFAKAIKKENKKEMKNLLKAFDVSEEPRSKRYKSFAVETDKAFKVLKSFKAINSNNLMGDRSFNLLKTFNKTLNQALIEYSMFKVNISAKCVYSKQIEMENGEIYDDVVEYSHQLSTERILTRGEIPEFLTNAIEQLKEKIDAFEQKGSGWNFIKVSEVTCNIIKYKPIKGGSYIELPLSIQNKKCCINIKNDDQMCFKWCILYHFNRPQIKKNPQRVAQYKQYEEQFNFKGIDFPVAIKDIGKIEKIINKPINVFTCGLDKQTFSCGKPITVPTSINPLRISSMKQQDDEIDLLLLNDKNNNHYVYIKDFNVLATRGKNSETEYSTKNKRYYCKRCIHGFTTPTLLQNHLTNGCLQFEPTKCELPNEKDGEKPTISFKNHYKQIKAPFKIYADFESFLTPKETSNGPINYNKSFTTKTQEHEACGYAYKIVSTYKHLKFPMTLYRGADPAKHFIESILKTEDMLMSILKENKHIIITPEQEKEFKSVTNCIFCKEELKDDRVRDHDHLTGLYRGAAHNKCNINFNDKNIQFPVFFHNLKNYDGHLIIRALNDKGFGNIRVIAQNFEKYISFQVSHLKFLDSCSFLASSLDNLANNLAKEGEGKFKHTLENVTDTAQRNLLLQKGIYPYEYMTDESKFLETELPPKEKFYSQLNESGISDKDYAHAQNVWKTFKIKNMGEYHDLYLDTDVNILADVFENFIDTAMKYYGLDPCHYLSLPNFAWDAMLKFTGITLDQITAINLYQMIEKGLRGGISMITHRHAKANNKYMKNYDENKTSSFITYLDANNLYGWAMAQFLPESDFGFVEPSAIEFALKQALKASETSPTGYILEVDLDYPAHLHDEHNDYPLAPEQMTVEDKHLSPYASSLKYEMKMSNVKVAKLVPNLNGKTKYVVHYRNLQYYISKGLVLTKVHRIIQYKQSAWLKPYIDFNSEKRAQSKNAFEKDFFKLMNNAVFGKTMENVRNRVDIRLINNETKFLKLASKPTFETCQVYDENLVAVQMKKTRTVLDKPIYVGMAVLDLSKLHMYKFHYDYIKEKYGNKAQLLFTDTDSLTYHIQTEDLYADMKANKDKFDFSNYKQNHFCFDDNNQAVGNFKDETKGIPINEFVGLRSKMYSIKLDNDEEKQTGKGIKKQALKNKIKHSDYYRCLFGKEMKDKKQMISFNLIRSEKHIIYTYSLNKVGLSRYDDKRYLLGDGIASHSYGHYKI